MTTNKRITMEENKNIEKQMGGCMGGFFNLFDRNHLLSGKRLYPKRLPSPVTDSASKEFEPQKLQQPPEIQSPVPEKDVAPPVPPPVEVKESAKSPWKFTREAPRLSLDSRAITDAKGGLRPREIRIKTGSNADDDGEMESQRRSPSVIARLMGLEPLPSSTGSGHEPVNKAELRRSASESRTREYRFVDAPSFPSPEIGGEGKLDHSANKSALKTNNNNNNIKMRNHENQSNNQRRSTLERRSYYDTTDFFPPEVLAKHQNQGATIYGEIERRLRMKGIDEQSKDLETSKHILEAMQLKGLLHSSSMMNSRHNVVYDPRFYTSKVESSIMLKKSARPTSPTPTNRRRNNNVSFGEPSVSPRRERPGRAENRSSSPVVRRKGSPLGVEKQRRVDQTTATTTRSSKSPVRSPRMMRRSDLTVSRSSRSRRSTAEDEVSTVSESSFSTSSLTDNERWRVEEHKDGRNLLERCDKLLNSIAEITASSSSNSSELQQPSPVSVLDSSFYKEDESSPSPVKKRTIDFKDQAVIDLEDELWSPPSSIQLFNLDNDIDLSDDSELSYVSEVIRASNYFPDDNHLFLLLEKQSSITGIRRDISKASILQRKLIFDTVIEILDRNRRVPPWKVASTRVRGSVLDQIWSEFQKIREQGPSEDLFEVVCGVLKKDLVGDSTTGWSDFPVEMSEAVLDIERLIFKDLIGESIRDLVVLAGKNVGVKAPCRKLVF